MPEFLAGFVLGIFVAGILGVLWHRNIIQRKTVEWSELAEDKLKATADRLRGTF